MEEKVVQANKKVSVPKKIFIIPITLVAFFAVIIIAGVAAKNPPPVTCTDFTYSAFDNCQPYGKHYRSVISRLPIGCTAGNSVTEESCAYTEPAQPETCTNFTYSTYGDCQSNSKHYRSVISSLPAYCTGGNPVTEESCVYTAPSPPLCTSFDYTNWSHCATDGTQSRVITAAYPDGCTLTDSAPVTQQQQCKYTPLNLSADDIINKMVGQIHAAPDQTITTQYFAGHSGDVYIATNKWKLSSDETTLFFESTSKSRTTGTITDHIILADTDKDFRPDTYSDNGDQWHNLTSQQPALVENYTLIWAVGSAYFGSYLLNY